MKLLLYERLERRVVNDMNGEIERLTGLWFVVNKVGRRGGGSSFRWFKDGNYG